VSAARHRRAVEREIRAANDNLIMVSKLNMTKSETIAVAQVQAISALALAVLDLCERS
jgi:hypothetical protein